MKTWMTAALAAFATTLIGAWRADFRAYREAKKTDPELRYDWSILGDRILGALDAAIGAGLLAGGFVAGSTGGE